MKLYELAGAYAELQQRADDGEDVSELLGSLEGELTQKADSIARVLRNLTADADGLDAEIKRLTARKRAVESNAERLREYLRVQLEIADCRRIKTDAFTVSLADSPEKVEVVDESLVPEEYTRTKREISKTLILAAFKQHGELVPGVLITRGTRLAIR